MALTNEHNRDSRAHEAGLWWLRLSAGTLMLSAHGLPKLLNFAEKSLTFADPLHIGTQASLTLAIGGELLGAFLVTLGLFTRPAALSVLVTMLVAGLIHHAHDPWAKKELALVYAVSFAAIALAGPDRFGLDAWIARRRRQRGHPDSPPVGPATAPGGSAG